MGKDELIQARVSKDVKREFDKLAEEHDSQSDFLRQLVRSRLPNFNSRNDILDLLATDLQELAKGRDESTGVYQAITEQVWDDLEDEDRRSVLGECVTNTDGEVWIVGQGSSLTAGKWLADRLRSEDVDTRVGTPVDLVGRYLGPDDTLVAISRSGETDSILSFVRNLGSTTVVGVTSFESSLDDAADHVVPLPEITESVDRYATKSLIAQIAVMRIALFDATVDEQTVESRFRSLQQFLDRHFNQGESIVRLERDSPFHVAAKALKRHDDLESDPIFGYLSNQRGYASETQIKAAELVHLHGEGEHLTDVRHRLLNLLFRNKAYLLTVVPEDPGAFNEWTDFLFRNEDSLANKIEFGGKATELPILAISLGQVQPNEVTRKRSKYGREGVMVIDQYAPDPGTRELLVFAAIQLFMYAVLCQLWGIDPDLQSHVIEEVYDDDVSWEAM